MHSLVYNSTFFKLSHNQEMAEAELTKEMFEIDRSHIKFVKKLSAGNFGEVWEGLWNNETTLAVKAMKPGTTTASEILGEAVLWKKLCHPKLVWVYGVCSKEEPIFIVTELMKHGSLKEYLECSEGRSLKLPQLINMICVPR